MVSNTILKRKICAQSELGSTPVINHQSQHKIGMLVFFFIFHFSIKYSYHLTLELVDARVGWEETLEWRRCEQINVYWFHKMSRAAAQDCLGKVSILRQRLKIKVQLLNDHNNLMVLSIVYIILNLSNQYPTFSRLGQDWYSTLILWGHYTKSSGQQNHQK